MDKSREYLRMQFEAETDIVIEAHPDDWKDYALWLEKLSIKDLNSEVIKMYKHLREKVHQVVDILEGS